MLPENERFDFVTLNCVLGEIPNKVGARAACLRDLGGLLKANGGILCVTEHICDPHFTTKWTLRRLAREAGLEECGGMGPWFAYSMHFRMRDAGTPSG